MVRTLPASVDCSESVTVSSKQEQHSHQPNSKMSMSLKNVLPGSETKSGFLKLVMGPRRQRLQVKIYNKTLDPFAAFYPDKKYCRHCGVMKLRGCRVESVLGSETDFRVIPKSTDGDRMVVFAAETLAEKEDWIKAFSIHSPEKDINGRTRSISLKQFRMPSLAEMDEETCSDSSDFEHEDEESSHSSPTYVSRSRHHFIKNLDSYSRRARCCSHPGPAVTRDLGRDYLTTN